MNPVAGGVTQCDVAHTGGPQQFTSSLRAYWSPPMVATTSFQLMVVGEFWAHKVQARECVCARTREGRDTSNVHEGVGL